MYGDVRYFNIVVFVALVEYGGIFFSNPEAV